MTKTVFHINRPGNQEYLHLNTPSDTYCATFSKSVNLSDPVTSSENNDYLIEKLKTLNKNSINNSSNNDNNYCILYLYYT